MALVADVLAHVADAAPSPKEVLLVHSAGEVLLLAQWWLLGERVAHTWRVYPNVRFVATPAQAAALAALVPNLRAELVAAEATGIVDAAAVGSCLSRLAVLLDAQGATAEAAPLHARALTLAEAAGGDSAQVAKSLQSAGQRLYDQGDYAGTVPVLQRALAMFEAVHGLESKSVAACLSYLARALKAQGDTAAALPLHRRALAIRETALGPQHPHAVAVRATVSRLL